MGKPHRFRDNFVLRDSIQIFLDSTDKTQSLSDQLSMQDNLSLTLLGALAQVNDSMNLQDSIEILVENPTPTEIDPEDQLVLTDAIELFADFFLDTADQLSLLDSVNLGFELGLQLSDALNMVDGIQTDKPTNPEIGLNDSMSMLDDVKIQISSSDLIGYLRSYLNDR